MLTYFEGETEFRAERPAVPEREGLVEALGIVAGSVAGVSLLHSGSEEQCYPAQAVLPFLLWVESCSLLPSTQQHNRGRVLFKETSKKAPNRCKMIK